jgi:hypothetical protein
MHTRHASHAPRTNRPATETQAPGSQPPQPNAQSRHEHTGAGKGVRAA